MTQGLQVAARKRKRRINVVTEKGYSLHEFGRAIDPPVLYETVLKWVTRGLKSNTGKTVFLETYRGPRGQRTTMESYWRMIQQLNDD